MYQSSAPTPSGTRSSTPADSAAAAVVTRSTPSAPSPRRRSQSAATRDSVRLSSACGSGSTTKSFWVPWPFAKFTCSGYVAPRPLGGVDERRTRRRGRRADVEPLHAMIPAKPGPLAPDVAAGAEEGLLARLPELIGAGARRTALIQRRHDLGVAQRARSGGPVAQAPVHQRDHLADQALVEHRVGAPGQPLIEKCCVAIQPDDGGVPPGGADLRRGGGERLTGQLDHFQGSHRAS